MSLFEFDESLLNGAAYIAKDIPLNKNQDK